MARADGLILQVEKGDADEARDLDLAKAIGADLVKTYPNYLWIVRFVNHNLVIYNALVANAVTFATGREGFSAMLPRNKIGTVHEAVKTAREWAGATLECFGLPRGPWDGQTEPKVPQDLKDAIWRGQAHKIAQILGGLVRAGG